MSFPSHTAQNMLRRAWTSYVETHGGDDKARSERAVMMQKYLRNIAADRVAAHNGGGTFDFIQLRVVTLPVAAPGTAAGEPPADAHREPAPALVEGDPPWEMSRSPSSPPRRPRRTDPRPGDFGRRHGPPVARRPDRCRCGRF